MSWVDIVIFHQISLTEINKIQIQDKVTLKAFEISRYSKYINLVPIYSLLQCPNLEVIQ